MWVLGRFHWWHGHSVNRLVNKRAKATGWWANGNPAADAGCTNWRNKSKNWYGVCREKRRRGGSIFEEGSSLLPVSSLFSQPIFWRLQHIVSASGDSSNTLLWPKYSSVVLWLAKRRSKGGGVVFTTSAVAPLKFKHLYKQKKMDQIILSPLVYLFPMPPVSCPYHSCHSRVTLPRHVLLLLVFPSLYFQSQLPSFFLLHLYTEFAQKRRDTEWWKEG